ARAGGSSTTGPAACAGAAESRIANREKRRRMFEKVRRDVTESRGIVTSLNPPRYRDPGNSANLPGSRFGTAARGTSGTRELLDCPEGRADTHEQRIQGAASPPAWQPDPHHSRHPENNDYERP